ncbi:hypothetical protein KUCAC02_009670, partial [Chaenocephalus aceratus]
LEGAYRTRRASRASLWPRRSPDPGSSPEGRGAPSLTFLTWKKSVERQLPDEPSG